MNNSEEELIDLIAERRKIDSKITAIREVREEEKLRELKKYVGRCFKHKTDSEYFYYKVLSELSTGPTISVACLRVNPILEIKFEDRDRSKYTKSIYNNDIPFDYEDIPAFVIDNDEEISVENFEEIVMVVAERIIKMSNGDYSMERLTR